MLNISEKRKDTLISLTYFAVFIVLYYLFMKYAFWMVAPFLISFVIAMALQRPIKFLARKTFLSKKLTSVVFVLLIVAVLIGVLVLAGYWIGDEFYNFYQYIIAKFGNYTEIIAKIKDWIEGVLSHLPTALSDKAKVAIDNVTASILNLAEKSETAAAEAQSSSSTNIVSLLSTPISGILTRAKQIPSILTALLIGIVSCFFMTSDYDNFVGKIKNAVSKEHEEKLVKTKHIMFDVLGKWVKSYALILFITFCEITLGLSILKWCGLYTGGYIFVIAVCTALLDILPVFGTGTVMIPWAVISLFTHKVGLGIGLVVIYALITVIRQILEPKLVSANVDMHPVITLMCMYLGLQLFGFIGLIILPITVVIIKTLNDQDIIQVWGRNHGNKNKTAPAVEINENNQINIVIEENKEDK